MHLSKNITKKQKIAILTIGVLLLFIIIYSIITLISRIGKTAVTVQYAPYSATVYINDKAVKNKSTQYLKPGDYSIKVEANHFEPFSNQVSISDDYHYMVGILNASDETGENYIRSHVFEFTETEGIVGIAINAEGNARKKNHPILNYLPINNSLFSISYAYDTDNTTPIISVKSSPLYLDDAVAKIKTLKDIDYTNYDIVFKTDNPFAIYNESATGNNPQDCAYSAFNIPSNYSITSGQAINDDYYLLQFFINDYNMDYQYSHYRVILHREENNLWKIATTPQPLFTTKNAANIPKDIIEAANNY